MTFDFTGKKAVVTGASRGIGEAAVRQLDAGGARVALVSRSKDKLEAIAADLQHDPLVISYTARQVKLRADFGHGCVFRQISFLNCGRYVLFDFLTQTELEIDIGSICNGWLLSRVSKLCFERINLRLLESEK